MTHSSPVRILAALGPPSIILLTAVPLWGGEALPHWQMPGWLFLLPILGHAIASLEARRVIQTMLMAGGPAWPRPRRYRG